MNPDATQLITAMNHPLRRRILRKAKVDRPVSATQLSRRLDAPLGSVCYHVKILVELDVLWPVCTKRSGGAKETFYRSDFDGRAPWAEVALEACRTGDE